MVLLFIAVENSVETNIKIVHKVQQREPIDKIDDVQFFVDLAVDDKLTDVADEVDADWNIQIGRAHV